MPTLMQGGLIACAPQQADVYVYTGSPFSVGVGFFVILFMVFLRSLVHNSQFVLGVIPQGHVCFGAHIFGFFLFVYFFFEASQS